jgi:hypothetical protein
MKLAALLAKNTTAFATSRGAANFDIPNEGIERRHAPFTTFRVAFERQPQ